MRATLLVVCCVLVALQLLVHHSADALHTKLRIRFPQRIKVIHHHHTSHHYAEKFPYGAPIPPHFRSRRRYLPSKPPPVNFRRRRPPPPPKSFYGPTNYASRYRNWRPYREKYRDDPPPYYSKHYHDDGDDDDHYVRASSSRRPRPKRPSYPDHYPPYDDDYDSDHEYSSHQGSKYLKDYDDDEDSSHESSIRNYRKRRRNKKRNRPEYDHSRNYNTNHQSPVNQYAEDTRHFTNTYIPHLTDSYANRFQNNQGPQFGHGFTPGLSISESSQTRTNQHDDLLEAYQAVSYSKKQLPVYQNTPHFFRNYDLKRSWGTPETSVGDHDIGFGEGMEEVDGGVYATRDLSGI